MKVSFIQHLLSVRTLVLKQQQSNIILFYFTSVLSFSFLPSFFLSPSHFSVHPTCFSFRTFHSLVTLEASQQTLTISTSYCYVDVDGEQKQNTKKEIKIEMIKTQHLRFYHCTGTSCVNNF